MALNLALQQRNASRSLGDGENGIYCEREREEEAGKKLSKGEREREEATGRKKKK